MYKGWHNIFLSRQRSKKEFSLRQSWQSTQMETSKHSGDYCTNCKNLDGFRYDVIKANPAGLTCGSFGFELERLLLEEGDDVSWSGREGLGEEECCCCCGGCLTGSSASRLTGRSITG